MELTQKHTVKYEDGFNYAIWFGFRVRNCSQIPLLSFIENISEWLISCIYSMPLDICPKYLSPTFFQHFQLERGQHFLHTQRIDFNNKNNKNLYMCETDQVNSRALDRIRHECIFHPKIIQDKWRQMSKFSYLYQLVAISIPVLHIYKRIEMSLNSIANDYRKAMNRPKDRKKQHNSKKTWRLFSGFSCARWSKQYNAFSYVMKSGKKAHGSA